MEVDEGERVTVSISSRDPVRARLREEPLPGFSVGQSDLSAALDAENGLAIAASRYGDPLTAGRLRGLLERTTEGLTVAFGAPERGLPAILGVEAGDPGAGFDLWLNTVPNQGSKVVRTEEAVFATLATLTLTE
jgi:predicted SPOUT superfamily RNA methylase MTH1